MLPNLLNPPTDESAEASHTDNGVSLAMGSHCPMPPPSVSHIAAMIQTGQGYTVAPPSSDSIGLDSSDERSDPDDRLDHHHLIDDEDQDMSDMSDGGAALTEDSPHDGDPSDTTLSHAEQLNAEMDMLDAEVMGQDNLDDLFLDAHFHHSMMAGELPLYYPDPVHGPNPQFAQPSADFEDDLEYDGFIPQEADATNMPAATSEESLESEHLQDGEEGTEPTDGQGAQHDGIAAHSILPPPFPTLSSAGVGEPVNYIQNGFISLAEISAATPHAVGLALGPNNVPHVWVHGGWTPPPGTEVLMPDQSHQAISQFNYTDVITDDELVSEADPIEVDDQFNLSLVDFLYTWGRISSREDEAHRKMGKGPSLPAIIRQRDLRELRPTERRDLNGERCDIQRINWTELGVSRSEATQMRRRTYKNYTNLRLPLQWHPRLHGARLPDNENYFKFRRMDFDHEIHLSHFQLRNLMACASRDHIFYAGKSKVLQYTPTRGSNSTGPAATAMDLTDPVVQPYHSFSGGIQISTLTVAHDMLVAGGFCGEYGMVNLRASRHTKHTEGLISDHPNSITNHVQVHLSRSSSLPLAAFSSNDNSVRILDISTNKFIAEHKYEHAINCSTISPDQRLRALVGDDRKVLICNSDTGEILQQLEGHRDFGFACDWADDGWTVATGNQDMQVKIWDARKWTTSQGVASPIATIAAEMAGVRKLKFSPCGSGKRVLVAAEPADFVSIINAETFSSKQTLNFFGEIGGVDFTNDGQDLFIGNCDNMRGGIMEFERCDHASEALYGLRGGGKQRHRAEAMQKAYGYDWDASDEEIISHPKSRGTAMHRARMPAMLGTTMAPF